MVACIRVFCVSFVVAESDIFSSQHCTDSLPFQKEGYLLSFIHTIEFGANDFKFWEELLSNVSVLLTLAVSQFRVCILRRTRPPRQPNGTV